MKDQSESIKELIKIKENTPNPLANPDKLRILRENLTTITTTTAAETKYLTKETTINPIKEMPRDSSLSQDLLKFPIYNLELLDKSSLERSLKLKASQILLLKVNINTYLTEEKSVMNLVPLTSRLENTKTKKSRLMILFNLPTFLTRSTKRTSITSPLPNTDSTQSSPKSKSTLMKKTTAHLLLTSRFLLTITTIEFLQE